jgi:hypothetical protein
MTLRGYLGTMAATSVVSWLGWIYVLVTIDPTSTNWLGFLLFYLSLFLALTGTTAIAGFLVRFIALKHALVFRQVKDAFRQSFLFALLIVAALYLLSQHLFSWLNAAFLVITLSLLEYFLISYRKQA